MLIFAQMYRHVFKDTHREKALSNKTQALTKSTYYKHLGGWYIKSILFDGSHFSNNCNL